MSKIDKIDWSVLSGPYVSRRTMMKLAMATGAIPFASWLAACGGDDDDEATNTPEPGAGAEATATEVEGEVEATATEAEGGAEATATEEMAAEPTATPEISLTAAPETPTPSGEAKTGGTLILGYNISQVTTLDPAIVNQGVVAGELISNLFSALVQFDENLGIVPDLAETWEVSEDGTVYVFHIRAGLTHHNGDSLTAQDFVYTYERNIDPDFASPHANKLRNVTEITATDEVTLTLTLSDPFAPFLATACSRGPGRALTPISQRAFEEMGADDFAFAPVGCGPFMIEADSRVIGEGFTLVAFEDWYGGRPYLDEIEVVIITEPSSMVSALEAGDIDMLLRVPTTGVEQIEANSDITTIRLPGTSWNGLTMNYNNPPWDNPKARMAVSKAINRQEFVDTAFLGLAIPGYNAVAPAFAWAYTEIDVDDPSQNPQGYDLEEAKALAAEAIPEGTTAVLIEASGAERQDEVLRNMLAEIGVDVQIEVMQSAAVNERFLAGEYDMNTNGSVVDADPDDGNWNFFHSTGPWNTYGFIDPESDRLLELTRSTSDIEIRRQAWTDLSALLNENAVYAFLNHNYDFVSFYPYVMGYRLIPEIRYFESVWLDQ